MVNLAIIYGISAVLAYLNTGAERNTMLHSTIEAKQLYTPKILWDTTNIEGRPIEKQTLQDIQKDYLNAWYIKAIALQTNDAKGIDNYYTDSTRVQLYQQIEYNKTQKIHIESTTLQHNPALYFYSQDGQLVVFNDTNVVSYNKTYVNNQLILKAYDTATYQVVMLLEDGFWRIRHLIKKENKQQQADTKYTAEQLSPIKGINYYPKDAPWDMFGDTFDTKTITSDFKLLHKSNINTIRIFIPYDDFGAAEVDTNKLKKLTTLLNIAHNNNLKAIVTLFDFYGNYEILDWSLTQKHAITIVKAIQDHPALLAWDIKNEPDLDFKSRNEQNVTAWLQFMINEVKLIDPKHPVTIGWSNAKSATLLKDKVDIISFHFYEDESLFTQRYDSLKTMVKNKPILVEEYGVSSYKGFWNPFGKNQDKQANYHKKMQTYFKKDSIHFMSWTMYDFNKIPETVVGKKPWRKAKQKHFGFIDDEGKQKPSFKYISH